MYEEVILDPNYTEKMYKNLFKVVPPKGTPGHQPGEYDKRVDLLKQLLAGAFKGKDAARKTEKYLLDHELEIGQGKGPRYFDEALELHNKAQEEEDRKNALKEAFSTIQILKWLK